MNAPAISIPTVVREARAAVKAGQSINHSCPYRLGSDEANLFERAYWDAFMEAEQRRLLADIPVVQP